MGGRGASSGVAYHNKNQLFNYGEEYNTKIIVDNIKFIEYNGSNSTDPWETKSFTFNRVYAVVTKFNKLKSIIFFNENGMRNRKIHLDHTHNKEPIHVHVGYEHNEKTVPLTLVDRKYIKKITKIWEEYLNGL